MKRIVLLPLALVWVQCSVEPTGDYLSCAGRSGVASRQSQMPLVSRVITDSETEVRGSLHVSTNEIVVEGIPFMAGKYKICQNADQALWFSPTGSSSFCAGNDTFNDLGVLNKVTGEVRYHVGDALFILNCKKAAKIVR